MKATVASICRRGGRAVNQDSVHVFADGKRMCLTACDGLGAYTGSGTASEICAAFMTRAFAAYPSAVTADAINGFFRGAHEKIRAAKVADASLGSCCTTAACVFADESGAFVAHAGDTRVYVLAHGRVVRRTADHSVAHLDVEKGRIEEEDLRFHKDQNKLTRVVGGKFFVLPDVFDLGRPAAQGDAFLLCTDGFWEYVKAGEAEEDIAAAPDPEEALARMERRLLAVAPAGHDNYSAILAVVE